MGIKLTRIRRTAPPGRSRDDGPRPPASRCAPYIPDDAPVLADIFRASIEGLAAEDYSETQIEAWARGGR
jgi:hypothetical protein